MFLLPFFFWFLSAFARALGPFASATATRRRRADEFWIEIGVVRDTCCLLTSPVSTRAPAPTHADPVARAPYQLRRASRGAFSARRPPTVGVSTVARAQSSRMPGEDMRPAEEAQSPGDYPSRPSNMELPWESLSDVKFFANGNTPPRRRRAVTTPSPHRRRAVAAP